MIKTMKISVSNDVILVLNGKNILFMQIDSEDAFRLFYDNYTFGFNQSSVTISGQNSSMPITTAYQVDLIDSFGTAKQLISSNFGTLQQEIKNSFFNT